MADFRPEGPDLDLRGWIWGLRGRIWGPRHWIRGLMPDLRPERPDLRPERPNGEGEEQTDKWANIIPPVFYGTSSPSGPLPKTWELLNSTDYCFNKQGWIHGCPSCLRVGRGTDKKVHKGIWTETVSSKKCRWSRKGTNCSTNQPTNQQLDGHTDRWTIWRVELCSTQLKIPSELCLSMYS